MDKIEDNRSRAGIDVHLKRLQEQGATYPTFGHFTSPEFTMTSAPVPDEKNAVLAKRVWARVRFETEVYSISPLD